MGHKSPDTVGASEALPNILVSLTPGHPCSVAPKVLQPAGPDSFLRAPSSPTYRASCQWLARPTPPLSCCPGGGKLPRRGWEVTQEPPESCALAFADPSSTYLTQLWDSHARFLISLNLGASGSRLCTLRVWVAVPLAFLPSGKRNLCFLLLCGFPVFLCKFTYNLGGHGLSPSWHLSWAHCTGKGKFIRAPLSLGWCWKWVGPMMESQCETAQGGARSQFKACVSHPPHPNSPRESRPAK